jgi:phosphatidylglycerophosphate synthase
MISYRDYRRNVREFRLEEPFDFILYRPIAYLIVRLTASLPLTPNHFSLLSLASGVGAGWFLAEGDFFWGGVGIFVFSILDCCDGMLARMKNNGTRLGVFIDMFVDALANIAFYLGLYLGLAEVQRSFPLHYLAPLSIVAITVHASAYHYYKKQLLSYIDRNPMARKEEIEAYRREYERLKKRKGAWGEKLLLRLFLLFSKLQKDEQTVPLFDIDRYPKNNKNMLALWGVIAGSTHLMILAGSLLAGIVPLYFFYALIFGNAWFVAMMAIQHRINDNLMEVV